MLKEVMHWGNFEYFGTKTVRKCLELHVVLTVRPVFYTKK